MGTPYLFIRKAGPEQVVLRKVCWKTKGSWVLPGSILYGIAIYAPVIYTAPYLRNVFDACRSITRASGRGLGPRNLDFFGSKWHSLCSLPFQGPKSLDFQGPTPSHFHK
jgi:hypothetical protein